ncbi:DUF2231 domain-containing protein [Rhizobium leguminosarum]|jgi:uncharacterized membrane protein|uniref:DUF2231 domain-containing protein n=1 Tax=Rhizobium TaxID=379 RepID=UPI001479285A|nr:MULTISPECIES: DUF2231 domain-containing protein [Rhizobium]MBY5357906.1 DUF2231 domain-containing protein [Rhizobium leguminosarum]MBY5368363.1 DUF2231 domain-containing protein [Rhizobium leguminosarum]MBY5405532.1 DUF2231 domain-containing protein [Rhizobium leguminosarum]MBY5447421.1 DUF2231 domain-containing protein [Rhizobium leguminosarum]NNG73935.1 DUF2231 domain-containing protein [Rhizobium laguerreae]
MTYPTPSSRVLIYSHPFRAVPLHFSAACFVGALATDIAYWRTAEMMWTNFSSWLLAAGLLLGGIAAIGGIADFATGRLPLRAGIGLLYALGNLAVFVLALFNAFVHSRDAWTSVVPTGLTLSAVTVVVIVINAVLGRMVQRQFFEDAA